MKVSCSQEALSKALNIVGRAVATRTTLPIVTNVLMSTEESSLRLAATNLEIGINCRMPATIGEAGSIAIPARLLTELVHSLPNEQIEMEVSPQNFNMSVRCLRYDARIKGLDARDFPPILAPADSITTTIAAETLKDAIKQVVFAAATDDTRPVLTGVYVKLEEGEMTLAAADGFRLAVLKAPVLREIEAPLEVIIPGRSLVELSRIIEEEEKPVEVTVTPAKGQILFHATSVDMFSQLIQGTFPNYSQLIPTSFSSRVVVPTDDFLKATRVAAIFARDASGIVRLQMAPGDEMLPARMTISARAEEVGENQGEIDAVVEGEAGKIAFNAKYLTSIS
ncbi:MAG: DNA polymerase III subunit beta [Chloroflexi bacterium]|nr:DNA polymerase III subunit beta [Chloroflexota bacterium]